MTRKGLLFATITVLILSAFLVTWGIRGIIEVNKAKEITDLTYAVPSVNTYETTAIQLSAEEVETSTGFFSYIERFVEIKLRSNPITIDGKDIEKVPSTNPNIKSFKDVKLFRSCFYNSAGHALDSRTGLFVSQAILFNAKSAADAFEKDSLKGFKNHYAVVLRKRNVVGVVNMFLSVKPTKELFELVEFAEKGDFKATVVDLTVN